MLCAITSKRSLKDSSAGTLNNYGAAKLATAESNAVDDRWRIKSGALHLPPSPSPGSWSSESSPFFGLRFDCACNLPSTAEFIGQRRIIRYLRYSSWCMLAQAYSTCRASTAPRPLHSTPTAMVSTNNNVFAPYLLILGIN